MSSLSRHEGDMVQGPEGMNNQQQHSTRVKGIRYNVKIRQKNLKVVGNERIII